MNFLAGISVADKIYWASGCTVEIKDVNTMNSSIANLFKPAGFWGWMNVEGQNAVLKDNKIVYYRAAGNDTNNLISMILQPIHGQLEYYL
jgi:hypothetical protein